MEKLITSDDLLLDVLENFTLVDVNCSNISQYCGLLEKIFERDFSVLDRCIRIYDILFRKRFCTYYLLCYDTTILGIALIEKKRDYSILMDFGLLCFGRHKGFGSSYMDLLYKEIGLGVLKLDVKVYNHVAISFYKSKGFFIT